jgi:hypothetical protein
LAFKAEFGCEPKTGIWRARFEIILFLLGFSFSNAKFDDLKG